MSTSIDYGGASARGHPWKKLKMAIPYLGIGYVCDKLAEGYVLSEASMLAYKLVGAVNGLFEVILQHPLPRPDWRCLLFGFGVAIMMRLIVWAKSLEAKKFRHGVEYGSARWGTRQDIEPFLDPEFKRNIILTQTEGLRMTRPDNPSDDRNKNVLVIGGSGAGKTRFVVKPNLMQMHSSYVITDPKGTMTLTLTVTDKSGNKLTKKYNFTVTAEKKPTISGCKDSYEITEGENVTLCGTISSKTNLTVVTAQIDKYNKQTKASKKYTSAKTKVDLSGFTVKTAELEPGEYTIKIYAKTVNSGDKAYTLQKISVTVKPAVAIEVSNDGAENRDNSSFDKDILKTLSLSELGDLDYLAFSEMVYRMNTSDLYSSISDIMNSHNLLQKVYCTKKAEDNKKISIDVTYDMLCNNILNWYCVYISENRNSGFFSAVFTNGNSEYVMAFEGTNEFADWVNNVEMGAKIGAEQYKDAINAYMAFSKEYNPAANNMVITGHSLGGGLADIISALSGSKGVSFNAAPFLTVAYIYEPELMGENYHGIDNPAFCDHINKSDTLVGRERAFQKNAYYHKGVGDRKTVEAHMLQSFISVKADGSVLLTKINKKEAPQAKRWDSMFSPVTLYMGSSKKDVYNDSGLFTANSTKAVFYGGDGDDVYYSNSWNTEGILDLIDIIIGGPGNDQLDGGYGDDSYLEYKTHISSGKNNYVDIINDVYGNDAIKLIGFSASDKMSIETDGNYNVIKCNGKAFCKIIREDNSRIPNQYRTVSYDKTKMIVKVVTKKK